MFRSFLKVMITQDQVWKFQHFINFVLVGEILKIHIIWLIELGYLFYHFHIFVIR